MDIRLIESAIEDSKALMQSHKDNTLGSFVTEITRIHNALLSIYAACQRGESVNNYVPDLQDVKEAINTINRYAELRENNHG